MSTGLLAITFALLGDSQTFLGVLATIIILFIFKNSKSNAISLILDEAKFKFENLVKVLKNTTETFDSKICDSPNYNLLNHFIYKEENKKDPKHEEILNQVLDFLAEVRTKRNKYKLDYEASRETDKSIIDSISNSKEWLLAPLYTLLFCLTVFIFDELLRAEIVPLKDFLFSVLSCFVFVSYAFWILLWMQFLNRFRKFDNNIPNDRKDSKITNTISKFWSKSLSLNCLYCILAVVIWPCILLVIHAFLVPLNNCLLISLSIVLPICLVGYLMFYIERTQQDYSYLFVCGHFCAIFIVSFLQLLLYFVVADLVCVDNSAFILETSTMMIKISIFVFTIFNGIILPFSLPYLAYFLYYEYSKKMSENDSESIAELVGRMSNLAERIPPINNN